MSMHEGAAPNPGLQAVEAALDAGKLYANVAGRWWKCRRNGRTVIKGDRWWVPVKAGFRSTGRVMESSTFGPSGYWRIEEDAS